METSTHGSTKPPVDEKEILIHSTSKTAYGTDLSKWRLTVSSTGENKWEYHDDDDDDESPPVRPQNFPEKYWLGIPSYIDDIQPPLTETRSPQEALLKGQDFLKRLQSPGGSWGANGDGPMYAMPGAVISMYIIECPIEKHIKQEMIRYLINVRNDDGGWGGDLQAPSSAFGTSLCYVTLRLLGVPPEDEVCVKARTLLLTELGSALACSTWGRFWLCLLGLAEWEGIVPLLPEPSLIPSFLGISPANWWVPLRGIYHGMSYCYGHRLSPKKDDPLVRQLRTEMYNVPYESIDWRAQRSLSTIRDGDRVRGKPASLASSATAYMLGLYEDLQGYGFGLPFLRKRALREALFQIEAEVYNTNYISFSPVHWGPCMIVLSHVHGPDSPWVKRMLDRFPSFLWMCREGMGASATEGCPVWDTIFAAQALCVSAPEDNKTQNTNDHALQKALAFLSTSQLKSDPMAMHLTNRHATKGGWPYSTVDQAHMVADCTAEALVAVLSLHARVPSDSGLHIPRHRLLQALDNMLTTECLSGGGFQVYDPPSRSSPTASWLLNTLFNLTDMYEGCMTEHLYADCTGSVLSALAAFSKSYPDYRKNDIAAVVERSISFVSRTQEPNGGWRGNWGVCYTYATCFVLQGLRAAANLTIHNSEMVWKAATFLLMYQNEDGGWGESSQSALENRYVRSEKLGSQVHNTAWAVSALIAADCTGHRDEVRRGVDWLVRMQVQETGEWKSRGETEGYYCPPAGRYRYPLYKLYFPVKALGEYLDWEKGWEADEDGGNGVGNGVGESVRAAMDGLNHGLRRRGSGKKGVC